MVNMDVNAFEERLLTVDEVARYLGYTPGTVRNKVSAGEIPYEKLPSGAVRFRLSTIDAWVSSGRNGTAENAPTEA